MLDNNTSRKADILLFLLMKNEHDTFIWTVCHNNFCYTHMSDKTVTEWFSKKKKQYQEYMGKVTQKVYKWNQQSTLQKQDVIIEILD